MANGEGWSLEINPIGLEIGIEISVGTITNPDTGLEHNYFYFGLTAGLSASPISFTQNEFQAQSFSAFSGPSAGWEVTILKGGGITYTPSGPIGSIVTGFDIGIHGAAGWTFVGSAHQSNQSSIVDPSSAVFSVVENGVLIQDTSGQQFQILGNDTGGITYQNLTSNGEVTQTVNLIESGDALVIDRVDADGSFVSTGNTGQGLTNFEEYDIGGTLVAHDEVDFSSGGYTRTTFDPLNAQSWDTNITAIDSNGNLTSDLYNYNIGEVWVGAHDLSDIDIGVFDEAAAEHFFGALETAVYAGDLEAGGIPSAFSFRE